MSANVVITGQGIVSAIGIGAEAVLDALRHGRTGIGPMRYLGSSHHELPVGEVDLSNEQMKAMLGIESSREVSRTSLMGMLALQQAVDEGRIAHLKHSRPATRVALVSGTTVGGMDITERHFGELLDGDYTHLDSLRQHDCGSSTELMAAHIGLFDEASTISTACSSAANAIILGARLLEAGQADVVVAGGTEALSLFHLNGFNSLQILDTQRCRPFDDSRAGLNLGEGAAFVVMEREGDAATRQAHVLGYLTGYGNACDAFHQTASSPDGEGAYRAMTQALEMAGLQPRDIHYVNAHGTATPNNDLSESAALLRVFGNDLPPVSSTKCYTGHTTSASGSIEAVICLLAMRHGFVPANLGWATAMPGGITPSLGIEHHVIDHVMCNSFGFGGNDSSLVFSRQATNVADAALADVAVKVLAEVDITDDEQLADIRNYVKPLEARRMGKIMKSSLLASLKALQQAGIETPDAIVTATAWGCLEYSERLLEQLRDEGEVLLKPTYFMQSTHNTISSNIAMRLKCHGYNVTYSHGAQSLQWAMRDAEMLLRSGRCKTVLVGLHDEMTPTLRQLLQHLGIEVAPSSFHSKAIVLSC